jgi:hypothetical protein
MLSGKYMPKTPKGHKRPADVISNAVHVMRIGTGEVSEPDDYESKNSAAVELGRSGGNARAKSLSAKRKREIASNAAQARWATKHQRYAGRGRSKKQTT